MSGLTKRDIQLFVDGGFHTVEAVAYTPKMILERIKGVSENKASKVLMEGENYVQQHGLFYQSDSLDSFQTRTHGIHNRHRNACPTK